MEPPPTHAELEGYVFRETISLTPKKKHGGYSMDGKGGVGRILRQPTYGHLVHYRLLE
jgi:hypothetical protein